jgi:polar amino acid transport system substrate-binding protein
MTWAESLSFVTIDYCPFTCDPSQEGGKEGFMTDVVREAFEGRGYSVDFEMLPYVRAVKAVQEGRYDGIVVVGRDYAPDLVYPDVPTVVQRVAFLVDVDSRWRYTGIESLLDIKVGTVRGFHYVDPELVAYLEAERDNEARVNVIHGERTTIRGIRMLQRKRISTFLEGEFSVLYVLEKLNLWEQVIVAGYTRNAFEDYTAFSPLSPYAQVHADVLSDAIDEMKETGRLAEILRKYGISSEQ